MARRWLWIVVVSVASIILRIAAPGLWLRHRFDAVLALRKGAKAGMPFSELLKLEKHQGIDNSFIVQASFADWIDQSHSPISENQSRCVQ